MLNKWKKAIVRLECAADSEHFYDRIKWVAEQRALRDQGQITHEQFAYEVLGRSRDIRYRGTALLHSHVGRRYLLTARHVVFDERAAKRELEEEAQSALSWPENMRQHILQPAIERVQNNIFHIIFRVASIDEVISGRSNRELLINLGAGTPLTVPYTFSDPELDLALISLDQRNSCFASELDSLG